MRPTQRSNRRPQRRPYKQHAQRLHQMDNPSIRRRENVHHRRTESSPTATLPTRGVFGPFSSWCRNICVIGHSTSANGTAPVPGVEHRTAHCQQIIPCCITARQPQL
ncbi:hypothetical protein TcG_11334 [Trypanosoma cruzi]|nr:hypothetical protein TcG_11330 [Trypanosoma cruzi]RNF02511.1 hypothetical protein TcG_11334 [Trypanosoma cruzi]